MDEYGEWNEIWDLSTFDKDAKFPTNTKDFIKKFGSEAFLDNISKVSITYIHPSKEGDMDAATIVNTQKSEQVEKDGWTA